MPQEKGQRRRAKQQGKAEERSIHAEGERKGPKLEPTSGGDGSPRPTELGVYMCKKKKDEFPVAKKAVRSAAVGFFFPVLLDMR